MQSRLFILTSNLALAVGALAAFLTPYFIAESYLVPAFSRRYEEWKMGQKSLIHLKEREILHLGDSTIRDLQRLDEEIIADSSAVNLGAGGSTAPEWYFFFRNILKKEHKLRVVVVGMAHADSLEAEAGIDGYYPLILEKKDIFSLYREGAIQLSDSIRLAQWQSFPLVHSRAEILTRILPLAFPVLGPHADRLVAGASGLGTPGRLGLPVLQREDSFGAAISALAKERGMVPVFVKSPLHSSLRDTEHFRYDTERFRIFCRKHQVRCKDMSAALEDHHFGRDRVHLHRVSVFRYRLLIDQFLIDEGLLGEAIR